MTGDEIKRERSDLSVARQRLLEARLARASTSATAGTQIPVATDATRFPATSPQARFWFLNRLDPESAAYSMHVALILDGAIDIDALDRALAATLSDHPVLCSRFVNEDGTLWQELVSPDSVELERHTCINGDDPDELMIGIARRPFDLDKGPLIRAHLVAMTADSHALLLVVHHIVCDEASIGIILNDLGKHYEAEDATTEAGCKFADYAYWEHRRQDDVLDAQLPYWSKALANLEDSTGVPPDEAPNSDDRGKGRIASRTLPASVGADARKLTASVNTTLFPLMTTLWCLLLHRYTGNRDVAVGTPANLRTLPELSDTVGLLINTLILRAEIDPDRTFRDTLIDVRDSSMGAFSNQDIPLEKVVQTLNPDRTSSAFFDTMIVQESEPDAIAGFGALSASRTMLDIGVCKFDLTLFFRDTADGLLLSVEYDTALYSPGRIEALLDHFANLLTAALADPDCAAGRLPLLSAEETAFLRSTSTGPWQDVGQTPLIATRVLENLASLGSDTAVVDSMGAVSYSELGTLAGSIAARLRQAAPDARCVVIHRSRDRFAIASMLAAWRLGACYVPLDPDYPPERIAMTLAAIEESELGDHYVIAGSVQSEDLRTDAPVTIVDEVEMVESGGWPEQRHIAADDLAYIVFTSGSTGTPKGVRITHENLRVSTLARREVYGDPPQCFLLLSPLAFDSSVAGLYWTLNDGGSLIVADHDTARDAHEIANLVARHRVTHTLMLPSLYALVLRGSKDTSLDSLSTVIVAGEACPESLQRSHIAALPACRLFNEYGPSEGTVWSTVQQLERADVSAPIGRAVPSMRAFVLDEYQQPLPPGYPGELCIAGPAVSPGYLDARQSEAVFIDTELFGESCRIYRTGDKVRLDDQGRLFFLGRLDQQVKVRGHRVELDDINAWILRQDNVEDAITIYDEPRQSLCAFVTSAAGADAVRAEALTESLRRVLPDYMVPSRLECVSELPRLPNGKIDTRALQPRQTVSAASAPNDPDFLRLQALWCSSLGIPDSGPDDNYFECGGHSLLALQLLLDIEDVFGTRLSLPAVYRNPTLSQLYALLHDYDSHDEGEILYPAKLSGSEKPLFIALAPLEQLIGEMHPELPLIGMYHGINPPPGPEVTAEVMATRYLDAVRRHQPGGPYRLAGYSFGCTLVLEMVQQLIAEGETVERVVLLDPPPPVPEGDLRFRINRVLGRIRNAGSVATQLRYAVSEAGRVGQRIAKSLQRRLHRRASRVSGRVPSRGALIQAGVDWSRLAARNYEYKPCPAPVLLVMPQRPEATYEQQLARWDGLLSGPVETLTLEDAAQRGPEHDELLDYPWVTDISAAINGLLVTPDDQRSDAA